MATSPCTSLLSLPVEDVFVPHILSCLSPFEVWNLRLVCRQFYQAVYCYYNTTCLEVKLMNLNDIETTDPAIATYILPVTTRILSYCCKLQKFSFSGSIFRQPYDPCLMDKCLLTWLANKSTLRELRLEFVYISQKTITALRPSCVNLRKLSFTSLLPMVQIFLCGEKPLELSALIEDCVTLEEYYSDDCSYQLQMVLMKQTKLKVLELTGSNRYQAPVQFESLFQALPSLQTLALGYIPYLTNEALLQALEYCPLLKNVHIFHCPVTRQVFLSHFETKGITVKIDI